jgi:hypothetical protein
MFEACLSLPKDPHEAKLIAESLEELSNALRDWSHDAWVQAGATEKAEKGTRLFDRLVAHTQPAALDMQQRVKAMESAAEVADVLRVLWPE